MGYFSKKGKQEQARHDRLVKEIIDYVTNNPRITAADIVSHLFVERRMKNHSLTPRKVGFFIPRHCKDDIGWEEDQRSGIRVYFPRKQLEDRVNDD